MDTPEVLTRFTIGPLSDKGNIQKIFSLLNQNHVLELHQNVMLWCKNYIKLSHHHI